MINATEEIEEENVIESDGESGRPPVVRMLGNSLLGCSRSAETSPVEAGSKASRLLTTRITAFFTCPVRSVGGAHSSFVLIRKELLGIWADL